VLTTADVLDFAALAALKRELMEGRAATPPRKPRRDRRRRRPKPPTRPTS
jgi:hypothetical protein